MFFRNMLPPNTPFFGYFNFVIMEYNHVKS